MRTRTRGGFIPGVVVQNDWYPNGTFAGTLTHVTNPPQAAYGMEESISDVPTRGFKKLQSQGLVIMNDVSISRTTLASSSQGFEIGPYPDWGHRTVTGDVIAFLGGNSEDPADYLQKTAEAKQFTLQKAYDKVASEDLMSLVTVAEAAKTAKMLATPFDNAIRLLRRAVNAKTKALERGLRLADAAAAAWAETRLGWKPFLFDVQNIADAYAQSTTGYFKPTRLVARSSFKHSRVIEDDYTWSAPFLGGVPLRRVKTLNTKVSSGVLYELFDESQVDSTARLMSLRLSDIPRSLWELIPYSFVVDRFISIGNWLNAITPKPGVSIKGSWITETNEAKVAVRQLNYVFPVGNNYCTVPGGNTWEATSKGMHRTANPQSPVFELPAWNPKRLSWQQTLDHYALAYGLLRGLGITYKG